VSRQSGKGGRHALRRSKQQGPNLHICTRIYTYIHFISHIYSCLHLFTFQIRWNRAVWYNSKVWDSVKCKKILTTKRISKGIEERLLLEKWLILFGFALVSGNRELSQLIKHGPTRYFFYIIGRSRSLTKILSKSKQSGNNQGTLREHKWEHLGNNLRVVDLLLKKKKLWDGPCFINCVVPWCSCGSVFK
jgi:hypothetical protein